MEWQSEELSSASGVPASQLRRHLLLFVNRGLVAEQRGPNEGMVYTRGASTSAGARFCHIDK